MNNLIELPNNNREQKKPGSKLLFYGLLLYTIIYYSQLGSRIPALGKMRIEFVIGLMVTVAAIPLFIKKITHNQEAKKIMYPIYFFFAAAVISIPTTVAGYNTIDGLIYLFKSFAIFIMIYATVNTEKKLRGFIYVLLLIDCVIIVEPFFSVTGGGLQVHGDGLARLHGVTGMFDGPNDLACFTAAYLPIIFFLFIYERSWIKKLILIALGLVTLRVIILTESRSAMLGVMCFIFLFWIISKKKVFYAMLIFIGLSIGWFSLDTITRERYLSIMDTDKVILGEEIYTKTGEQIRRGSMAKRYEIITDGLKLFLQRPITGFGINSFQIAREETFGRWQWAHNAYIQCLTEVGIVGFIPWCLILINMFILLGKARRTIVERGQINDYRFLYQMTYAFQCNLVVHFILSFFAHSPYDNYWWIPGAISLVMIRLLKENQPGDPVKILKLSQR